MNYSRKLFTIFCLSGAALFVPGMAQAADVPPAIQAWFDQIEHQTKIKPAYDSLETDGDGNVTISNLSLKMDASGSDPGMTATVGEAEFSDLSEEGDGLYQIGSASFSNMTVEIGDAQMQVKVTAPEGSSEGWYVQSPKSATTPEAQARSVMTLARKMSAGKMTAEIQGQTITIDSYESTWDGDPETGAGTFDTTVSNIAIPDTAIAMIDQGGMLKQLGYSSLAFDIAGSGKSEVTNGSMSLAFDASLSGRDMGAFKFGLSASDLPLGLFAELQKAQTTGASPDMNALMPQLQNVSFSGFTFRFEDASLTKKLLPMLAAMQGMDEKQMIASAGPMLQMGLMQLQNQAFAEQTSKAVNDFLNNPKSLTIEAKPAAPVKVSDMMAFNPAAPGEAITKLGISVKAND
jgi:hypothetical protein